MKTIYDKETVQSRMKYVLQVIDNDVSVAEAARNANVAWRTMKQWVTWFKNEGVVGLQNKLRGTIEPVDDDTWLFIDIVHDTDIVNSVLPCHNIRRD